MKISELVEKLQEVQKEHGDLTVYSFRCGEHAILPNYFPAVRNLKVKSGREYKQHLYESYHDTSLKGEKIVTV